MSENSKRVLEYLKSVNGKKDVTAADVAEALDLTKQQVNGTFTSGICRKGLGVRIPSEITNEDGTHTTVKYFVLTDAGMAFDPAADAE